jgi:hypothetical protein
MATFEARRASKDQGDFAYAREDGSIRTMHVTDKLLKPQDAEDDRALELAGYTVVAIAAPKSKKPLTAAQKKARAAKAREKRAAAKKREQPARPPEEVREVGDEPDLPETKGSA